MAGVRLEWDGKTAQVPRLHLPLQVVETVNSPRADRGTVFEQGPESIGADDDSPDMSLGELGDIPIIGAVGPDDEPGVLQ